MTWQVILLDIDAQHVLQQGILAQGMAADWMFSLFQPILCKTLEMAVGEKKFQKISSFRNTRRITFPPHSHARFELLQVVLTVSTRQKALSCCHVIG